MWWAIAAFAADLEVGGAGYADIGSALVDANPGDQLLLHDGPFNGSVTVTTDGLTIKPWPGEAPVLWTNGDAYAGDPEEDGYFLVDGVSLTVEDVEIGAYGNRIAHIVNGGSLSLVRVDAHDGGHVFEGGAIFVEDPGSAVAVIDGTISGCTTANGDGAAISSEQDTSVTIAGSRLQSNAVTGFGVGGAVMCGGVCTVDASTFLSNDAEQGGAIYVDNGAEFSVRHSGFAFNAASFGGAIAIQPDVNGTSFAYNVFWGNDAVWEGGAVHVEAEMVLHNNTFAGNAADNFGAALYSTFNDVDVINTIAVDQSGSAAGVFYEGSGALVVDHVLYDGNGPAPVAGGAVDSNVVNASPEFVLLDTSDFEGSDLSLLPTSPARCAGDGAYDVDLGAVTDGGVEIAGDGVDSDCDGVDLCYEDLDGDGFGTGIVAGTTLDCTGAAEAAIGGDCDDVDPAVSPDALEICDGVDNDCNALSDDDDPGLSAASLDPFYDDSDGDGYGIGDPTYACAPPPAPPPSTATATTPIPSRTPACPSSATTASTTTATATSTRTPSTSTGTTTQTATASAGPTTPDRPAASPPLSTSFDGGDCDDADPNIHPAALDACDGLDNDCNGTPDDGEDGQWYYDDADGDGFGRAEGGRRACEPPEGSSAVGNDCDDANAAIFPGAKETCNGLDDDCDGLVDQGLPAGPSWPDADGDGFGAAGADSPGLPGPGHQRRGVGLRRRRRHREPRRGRDLRRRRRQRLQRRSGRHRRVRGGRGLRPRRGQDAGRRGAAAGVVLRQPGLAGVGDRLGDRRARPDATPTQLTESVPRGAVSAKGGRCGRDGLHRQSQDPRTATSHLGRDCAAGREQSRPKGVGAVGMACIDSHEAFRTATSHLGRDCLPRETSAGISASGRRSTARPRARGIVRSAGWRPHGPHRTPGRQATSPPPPARPAGRASARRRAGRCAPARPSPPRSPRRRCAGACPRSGCPRSAGTGTAPTAAAPRPRAAGPRRDRRRTPPPPRPARRPWSRARRGRRGWVRPSRLPLASRPPRAAPIHTGARARGERSGLGGAGSTGRGVGARASAAGRGGRPVAT